MSQVVGAVILRDMRTRFGRSHAGYLVAILAPFVHLVVVVGLFTLLGRKPPIGTDTVTFFSTGILAFILFSYTLRHVGQSLQRNKPLLYFPRVKSFDIVMGRVILEGLAACAVCIIVAATLIVCGFDFEPHDVAATLLGFLSALAVGISLGMLAAPLIALWPGAAFLMTMIIVATYFVGGIMYLPDMIPEGARYWFSFVPLMHSIELVRMGVYPGYTSRTFNAAYLFWFPTVTTCLALTVQASVQRFIVVR